MHLYIATRGIKNFSDQFITELQGKYLPFKSFDENRNLINSQVQVAVRPIQLYEIVFPEEHKDIMLTTILGENGGKTQHKKHFKWVALIRKVLGIKDIGSYNTDRAMPISKFHTEIVGIGIKEDYYITKDEKHIYNPPENIKKECMEGL